MKRILTGAALISLFLTACGGSPASIIQPTNTVAPTRPPTDTPVPPTFTPEPTPTSTVEPTPELPNVQVGHWEGEDVSFDVASNGMIRNLRITIPLDDGIECIITMNEITISTDGTFAASSPSPVSGNQVEINHVRGEFLDTTNMSGVYGGAPMLCEVNNLTFFFEDPQDKKTINAIWKNTLMMQEEGFDGTWSGTTSAGKRFEFVVQNNVVNSILVEFESASGCESPYQVLNLAAQITANSFSRTGLFSTITGTFNSSSSASGEITLLCDPALTLTWTASRNP